MKHKRLKLSVLILLVLGLNGLQAQTSLNATGGDAAGSGGSVSYSLGQMLYHTHAGNNGSVSNGVQQPYEILTVTGIEDEAINLTVLAYPNPTADNITLHMGTSAELNTQSMSYQLYDMSGNLLQTEKITGLQTNINMGNLVSAIYIVKVLEGNKEIKTFEIIKN